MPQRLFELTPGVMVQTSSMWQMNSLVVSGNGPAAAGGAAVVVDPGWFPEEIDSLRELARATPAGRPTHVLLTHPDFDHVVGWAEYGDAQLLAHPKAAEREPLRSKRQIEDLDGQFYVTRPHAYRYPPSSAIVSPESLDLGGETALFFTAPGHQPDALFTILPDRRVLIAGDYMSNLEFPFVYYSFTDYRATLERARELCHRYTIDCLVPGHGRVAESREEINYRIDTDIEYLDELRAAVGKLIGAGVPCEEATARLSGFIFRGEPIAEHLLGEHGRNIRLLYSHPEQLK